MSEYQKISRSALYDEDSQDTYQKEEDDLSYMSQIQLDIVDIEKDISQDLTIRTNEKNRETKEEDTQNEEFDFPLFASPLIGISQAEDTEKANTKDDERKQLQLKRGRSATRIMKVSMREESLETVDNIRPLAYYYVEYNDKDREKFMKAAISGEEVIKQTFITGALHDPTPWKCIKLEEHNAKIDLQSQKDQRFRRNRRPGKKKRANKVLCRKRREEREKSEKKREKERQAKLKKKMFHKRGGKKHKKVNIAPLSSNIKVLKYRTE
ncbi:uncharacterized protein PRCAT00003311001 [Priceomyces carsonii]|uniref:uncharacterized protein n=1 Tax=Priceomyces carsonii TaxID=28549 RepID=UPI002ED7A489|nr:unnamed protein product [Priceomyces carsonii]